MVHYLYILECENGELYTGITQSLDARFTRHGTGRGGRFTKGHNPTKILYHEIFENAVSAAKREIQLKKWSRAKKLALINGDTGTLKQLSKSRD